MHSPTLVFLRFTVILENEQIPRCMMHGEWNESICFNHFKVATSCRLRDHWIGRTPKGAPVLHILSASLIYLYSLLERLTVFTGQEWDEPTNLVTRARNFTTFMMFQVQRNDVIGLWFHSEDWWMVFKVWWCIIGKPRRETWGFPLYSSLPHSNNHLRRSTVWVEKNLLNHGQSIFSN